MKNIYVGNLDFNVSEDQLRSAFEAFGAVDKATIIRDRDSGQPRGFAFVEMTDDGAADKAIQETNGAMLGNRAITVNEARPREPRSFSGPRPGGGGYGNRGGGGGGRGGYGGGGSGKSGGGGRGGSKGGGGRGRGDGDFNRW